MIRIGFLSKSVAFAALVGAVAFAGASCSDDQGFTGADGAVATAPEAARERRQAAAPAAASLAAAATATADAGEVCEQGHCLPAGCVDGELGGSESDVDCGARMPALRNGKICAEAGRLRQRLLRPRARGPAAAVERRSRRLPGADRGDLRPCASHDDYAASDGTSARGRCVRRGRRRELRRSPRMRPRASARRGRRLLQRQLRRGLRGCSADKPVRTMASAPRARRQRFRRRVSDEGAASCAPTARAATATRSLPAATSTAQQPSGRAELRDGDATPARSCDGDGSCGRASPEPCAPTLARKNCLDSCADDGTATTSYWQRRELRRQKDPATAAPGANECLSGFCPGDDGVCSTPPARAPAQPASAPRPAGAKRRLRIVTDNTDPMGSPHPAELQRLRRLQPVIASQGAGHPPSTLPVTATPRRRPPRCDVDGRRLPSARRAPSGRRGRGGARRLAHRASSTVGAHPPVASSERSGHHQRHRFRLGPQLLQAHASAGSRARRGSTRTSTSVVRRATKVTHAGSTRRTETPRGSPRPRGHTPSLPTSSSGSICVTMRTAVGSSSRNTRPEPPASPSDSVGSIRSMIQSPWLS